VAPDGKSRGQEDTQRGERQIEKKTKKKRKIFLIRSPGGSQQGPTKRGGANLAKGGVNSNLKRVGGAGRSDGEDKN